MNFNQWRNHAAKKDVAKITYICGEQNTLVELVIDDIKSILQVPTTDYVSVDASRSVNIWELASQYPLNPESNRLTVVRNCDRLESWDQLTEWLAHSRNHPKNFLALVSEQNDAPEVFIKGKRVSYADHIELIRNKGKFVKCSTPNYEDLISWIKSYGLSEDSAQFLVLRTSADIPSIFTVLKKVKIWNGPPNKKALALFCDEMALDSLADYLILQDKKSALLALNNLQPSEYSKVLTRLNSRLDSLLDINRCVARRMYDVEIAQTTGIKIFLVKKFKGVAREYDFNKVKQRRQVLTIVDSHLRNGATTGIMETLIALW